MRTIRTLLALSATVLLAACRGEGPGETAVSDDLQRDLDLASGVGVELASAAAGRGTGIVSAIEVPPPAARSSARAPAPARRRRPARVRLAQPAPEEVVATVASHEPPTEPSPVESVDEPIDEPPAPNLEPEASPAPDALPGPAPTVPVSRPGGRDYPEGIGGAGGVVIRGGAVGEDRCQLHDRRRRARPTREGMIIGAVGVLVNNRIPPIGRQTFPRRIR